jgi:hypothetical protein
MMVLQIQRGNEQPQDAPLWECSRLYFSDDFLRAPAENFTVILPGAPKGDEPVEDAAYDATHDGFVFVGWLGWPKGTLVKYRTPHVTSTWMLTGTSFPLTETTAYEAKWPD